MLNVRIINKAREKKYFLSITISSFLLFALFASTILFTSLYINRLDSRKKTIISYFETLDSYANEIEIKYKEIKSIAAQVTSNSNILRWIYSSPDSTDLYSLSVIQNSMNNLVISNDSVFSIDIYNNKSRSVLSTYSGYWLKEDGIKYSVFNKFLFDEFMNTADKYRIFYNPDSIYKFKTPAVTMMYSAPISNKLGSIAITVEVQKLLSQNIYTNKNLYIVAEDNSFFYNCKNGFLSEFEKYDLVNIFPKDAQSKKIYTVTIEQEKYYLSYYSILDGNLKLLTLIPESILLINDTEVHRYYIIMPLFIFILSCGFSLYIYNIAKKPIKNIVNNIKTTLKPNEVNKDNNSVDDEIFYLNATLTSILSKNSEIEKTLQENNGFFIENALRNLLFGRNTEQTDCFYKLKFINETLNHFIVLVISVDKLSEKHQQTIFTYLNNFLKNMIEQYKGGYIKTGIKNFTLLINLETQESKDVLMTTVRQLQASFYNRFHSTFSVGISNIRSSIEEISLCYNEAVEALKYKMILGNHQIIDSININKETNYVNYFSIEEGQLLMTKLKTGSEDEIVQLLTKIIDEKLYQYPVELLNAFLLYLSSCISKVAMEYNVQPNDIFNNNIFDIIIDHETIDDKKIHLINQCKKIVEVRKNEQKQYKRLSLEIVLKYIENNYDKPISLNQFADALYISPSYLSSLIKKELGMNFVSYLNKLRVEKASELLMHNKHTIKEIASMVGYDSEHTFIRNFKKIHGKTPNDFRNINFSKSLNYIDSLI